MISVEMELQGTPEQVAEQLFRKVISPVHGELSQKHHIVAEMFALSVCGHAIGCFISSCSLPPQVTADLLIKMIQQMAADTKQGSPTPFSATTEKVS